ncbi:MAG TPA: cysteine peptidase family C39 domain-containing protein, partial [Candidatus Angelobacter sp.]
MAGHRFIVPEIIQTSAMDCGPACLSSLLAGFGIRASYERLREACQTDVDGTSINTLEETANQLGLQTEQIMVPADYLLAFDPVPLPAITVVRLPSDLTHFVVVWNRAPRVLQIMDPAIGRTWRNEQEFLKSLFVHRMTVPVSVWREWAASEQFVTPLRRKMSHLGCGAQQIEELLCPALADPGWRPLATMEAAVRAVERMVRAGAFRRGREACRALQHFVANAQEVEERSIPAEFWSVQSSGGEDDEEVTVQGVILVTVRGRKDSSKDLQSDPLSAEKPGPSAALNAVLHEPVINPARTLLKSLWSKGKLLMPLTALALVLSAASVIVEAVLLRGLVDVFADFKLAGERLAVIGAVASFIFVLMLLDYSIAASLLHLGRRLEAEFRLTILRRLPHIADRYFRSRLSSDMAQRAHSAHRLRLLPSIYSQSARAIAELLVTAIAIVWLDRSALAFTIAVVGLSIGLPLLFNPILRERDLKVRNHVGALTRFYLDAMLGLTPLRAHGAERAFRREHTGALREWAGAVLGLQKIAVLMDGVQLVIGFGFAALLLRHLAVAEQAGTALLLLYWSLRIPMLAQDLALAIRQYPAQRNVALRVLEPLSASLEPADSGLKGGRVSPEVKPQGTAVRMEAVTVEAAGHVILKKVDLEIAPGTHVGIVGPSGAGKSSLVGLLLGFHTPASGRVVVDDTLLTSSTLSSLRREIAWIDPAVQLWNRSLLQNLTYGTGGRVPDGNLIEDADLLELLATFPDGLQTSLGENGGIVSGGEGQRVRMGRALLRNGIRLVVLDEPFRGLERQRRH